jgi:hypothetical protein
VTFSKWVFASAGVWGFLVVSPLYFLLATIGRQNPPAITHPEYYYGFVAVTLAWQLAFLVVASDPARFRPLMLPSIAEKLGFVATLLVLYRQGHVALSQLPFAAADFLLGVLFTVAFVKTSSSR